MRFKKYTLINSFTGRLPKRDVKHVHRVLDGIGYNNLIMSAYFNRLDIMKSCIKNNYINVQDKHGNTALIIAAKHGNMDMVKLLLSANANINSTCCHGNTALVYALSEGYIDIVNMFIMASANVDIQNYVGHTALSIASIIMPENKKIIKDLINAPRY